MNKKVVAVIGGVVVLLAAIWVGMRLANHGKDIIGVTSLNNSVIMNASKSNPFVGGSGTLTVGEGEQLHMTYSLTEGSFDVVLTTDRDALRNVEMAQENYEQDSFFIPDDWQSFEEELAKVDGVFAQGGIQGKGDLDFDAQPGTYDVIFYLHDAVGTATVTAAK